MLLLSIICTWFCIGENCKTLPIEFDMNKIEKVIHFVKQRYLYYQNWRLPCPVINIQRQLSQIKVIQKIESSTRQMKESRD